MGGIRTVIPAARPHLPLSIILQPIPRTELAASGEGVGSRIDLKRRTSLHYACYYGHNAIAKWLVNTCNVDIEAEDEDEDIAPELAERRGHELPFVQEWQRHAIEAEQGLLSL